MEKTMTRQELQQLLDELQDGIPQLRSDYPESEDFWAAFYGLVEVGLERAEPPDRAWFREALRSIIRQHGLSEPQIKPVLGLG
jgi:hypothetical protein